MIEIVEFTRRPGFHSIEKTSSGWKVSARHSGDTLEPMNSAEGPTLEDAIQEWADSYRESLIRGILTGPRRCPHDERVCLRSRMADRPISFEELKMLFNYWWISLVGKDRAPIPEDLESSSVVRLTPKSFRLLEKRDLQYYFAD